MTLTNYDKIVCARKGGSAFMPQLHSTDSFKMGERDRVNFSILQFSNVLSRSISINCYTFYNQRVT